MYKQYPEITMRKIWSLIHLSTLFAGSSAFSNIPTAIPALPSRSRLSTSTRVSSLSAVQNDNHHHRDNDSRICSKEILAAFTTRTLTSAAVSLAILTSPLHSANADVWGKETEAPTLFTGETTMICKKRGPLGACTETTIRTVLNDNDKALKYFKDPSAEVKRKQERMLQSIDDDSEGNALIQKLRKQSAENKEKNDDAVRTRTLLNDQGASFGPFSGQVVILNTDGKTFSLLQNPQAMRLKKAGYIEDRKFVIQPSQDVIDEALEGNTELGDGIKGFFGIGKGGGSSEEVPEEIKSETDDATISATEGKVVAIKSETDDATISATEEKVVVLKSETDDATVSATEEKVVVPKSETDDATVTATEEKVVVGDENLERIEEVKSDSS